MAPSTSALAGEKKDIMGNRVSFHSAKSFPSANNRTVGELRNETSPADSQIYHPCVWSFF